MCLFSKFPCRPPRKPVPPEWAATCRLMEAWVKVASLEIRIIVLYGVAGKTPLAVSQTQLLLQQAVAMAEELPVPTIIAGDMNHDVTAFDCWPRLQAQGYAEAHQLGRLITGAETGCTCRNATRNDTALLSPELVPYVKWVEVKDFFWFDSHAPLFITFHTPTTQLFTHRWNLPRSWCDLGVSKDMLAKTYREACRGFDMPTTPLSDPASAEAAIIQWAKLNEQAVSQALSAHNHAAPEQQPNKGLPKAYRGRCTYRKRTAHPICQPPRKGCSGAWEPEFDCLSFRSKYRVRQVRRLQSLWRLVKKHSFALGHPASTHTRDATADNPGNIPYRIKQQCEREWRSILYAPGYPGGFSSWVLQFPELLPLSLWCPSADQLHDILQIAIFDATAVANAEARRRAQLHVYSSQVDLEDFHAGRAFQRVKDPPFQAISCVEHEASGWIQFFADPRSDRHGVLEFSKDHPFRPHTPFVVEGVPCWPVEFKDTHCIVHADTAIPAPAGDCIEVRQTQTLYEPADLHDAFLHGSGTRMNPNLT